MAVDKGGEDTQRGKKCVGVDDENTVSRREVSFDGLVLGTRRGQARPLDTGAEEGVFSDRKRRSSSPR